MSIENMDISKLQERYLLSERCKKVALEFCANLDQRRFDLISKMFAPGALWRVNAREDRVMWGGAAPGSERAIYAGQFLSRLENWKHTVISVIGDGEKVVTKGITDASGPGSAVYRNTLSMHFIIDAETGKIKEFTEFMDCYEIEEWMKSMEASPVDTKKDVKVDSVAVSETV